MNNLLLKANILLGVLYFMTAVAQSLLCRHAISSFASSVDEDKCDGGRHTLRKHDFCFPAENQYANR